MVVTILSLLVFLPSLLVYFYAPTNFFWKVKLVVSELGHFLVWIPVILLTYSGNIVLVLVNVVSIILLSFPLVSSLFISKKLKNELEYAFPGLEPAFLAEPFNPFFALIPSTQARVKTEKILYSDHNLSMDFYANNTGVQPLLVEIHGGAWSSGDNTMFISSNRYIASHGFKVASVTYRLAPEHLFPAQISDIVSAIDLLIEQAEKLGIDKDNVFLLGRSAGGQIALKTAFQLTNEKIKGVVAIYTPADLIWGYSFPGNPLILDSRKVLQDYLGGTSESARENYFAASPVEWVNENTPPVLMIHGQGDEMVAYEHNHRLMIQLRKYGIPHHLVSVAWGTHGFDYFSFSPGGQITNFAITWFLKRFSS